MALMNCTGCGAKVSDRARYCIHCKTPTTQRADIAGSIPPGYDPPLAPSFQHNPEPPKKKRTGLLVGIIVGTFVLLAAAVLVYIFYFDGFSNEGANAANEPPNQAEVTTPPADTPPPTEEESPEETPEPEETPVPTPPTEEAPSGEAANPEIAAFLEEHRVAIYDMTAMMRDGMGADGRVEIVAGTGNELIYRFFYGSEFDSAELADLIATTLLNMGSLFDMLADSFRIELGLSRMQVTVYYYDHTGNLIVREVFESVQ